MTAKERVVTTLGGVIVGLTAWCCGWSLLCRVAIQLTYAWLMIILYAEE